MKKSTEIISVSPQSDELDGGPEPGADVECRSLSFAATHHGVRLDRALADLVPEFSRSYLQQLITLGEVLLNGQVVQKASHSVKAGDQASIELRPTPQSQAFKAEQRPLDLVFEDEHLLVICKPAGWVVHPAPGNWSGTLMNALLGFDARAFDLPRAGIVHRLDKDTSGLMVVARNRTCMDALVKAIAAREVKRHYLALAHGAWQGPAEQVADAAIGRDPANRLRMAALDASRFPAKPARTDVRVLASTAAACWVHCSLHTGRTHQIRVHMAGLGHPLLADALYGGAPAAGMQRQALHAYRLAFEHPLTHQQLSFEAPPPADFAAALAVLGLRYNSELI